MRKIFLTISILILVFNYQIFPQQFSEGSPEWLIDMFFNKDSFPEKTNYFFGEMVEESDQKTIGEELNGKGGILFHQLIAANSNCVFAVEVQSENKTIDFYAYLVKMESNWKLMAIRRFFLPEFIYTVRDSLQKIQNLPANDSAFLLSLQLFTKSDRELRNYLSVNQQKFQELISLFANNEKDKADIALAEVGCTAIYNDKKYPGCTFIQILQFKNMEAGFIHAADSAFLPAISLDEFIYIEEVVPEWFVFRVM